MPASPRAAFDTAVAEHEQSVLRICRSILGDEHLGSDAAQETFLRLWNRLQEDRAPERFGAWLRKVAVTTSLDLARRKRSGGAATSARLRDAGPADVSAPDRQAEDADRAALAEVLEAALQRLPEGQRTVFRLRHHGGLPLREVAVVLDLSLPTVKTQFARACLRLQSALSAFRPEDA